jgi:hypothetical protein
MFKRLRLAAVAGLFAATATPALSQGTLRIGMTAADIPQTTGQPDRASKASASPATPSTTRW